MGLGLSCLAGCRGAPGKLDGEAVRLALLDLARTTSCLSASVVEALAGHFGEDGRVRAWFAELAGQVATGDSEYRALEHCLRRFGPPQSALEREAGQGNRIRIGIGAESWVNRLQSQPWPGQAGRIY